MSEVRVVRLQTGEEIICKLLDGSTDNTKLLKKPAIIIPVGQGKIGLSPWLPYAEISDGIEIKESHIMFITEPVEEFLNEYNTAFGSGLVVPGANEVVGAGAVPNLKLTE
jgi:hypothetical protein|tara:strand:+ start:660 stop:989 length:330 start_codon:yes stop_codon:yes gene_type:complete